MEVYYPWFSERYNDFKKTLIIYKMVSDLALMPLKRHSIPQTMSSKKHVRSLQMANSFNTKWLQNRFCTHLELLFQPSVCPRIKLRSKIRYVAGIAFLVSPK